MSKMKFATVAEVKAGALKRIREGLSPDQVREFSVNAGISAAALQAARNKTPAQIKSMDAYRWAADMLKRQSALMRKMGPFNPHVKRSAAPKAAKRAASPRRSAPKPTPKPKRAARPRPTPTPRTPREQKRKTTMAKAAKKSIEKKAEFDKNGKVIIPPGYNSTFVRNGVVYVMRLQQGGTKGAKHRCVKRAGTKKSAKRSGAKKGAAKRSGAKKGAAKRSASKKTTAWKTVPGSGGRTQERTLKNGTVEVRATPGKSGAKKGAKRGSKKGGKRGAKKSGAKKPRTPAQKKSDKAKSAAMKGKPFGSKAAKSGAKKGAKKGGKRAAKKGGKSGSRARASTPKELKRDQKRRHAKGSRKPTRGQAKRSYEKRYAKPKAAGLRRNAAVRSRMRGEKAEKNRTAINRKEAAQRYGTPAQRPGDLELLRGL